MRVRLATLVAVLVVLLGLPVSAATGTSTDATPNFTESSGCGAQGVTDHVIPCGISNVTVLPVAGKTRLGTSASVAMAECAKCTPGS